MTINPINIGSAPNDGTGQDLRSGGQVINDNFAELDARTSAAQAKADQGVSDAATAKSAADAARAKADAAVPGSALGVSVAQLVNGTVPAGQLPSYVDDVLEYPTLADFPATGETGKIYIAINGGDSPTNPTRQYRWSGTAFVLIPASPGSTDQVPEGTTNLYFTAARVRSTLLTGLGGMVNAAILASDSILQAFAKLQGQINAKLGVSDTAADAAKLNGQPASFYTATMTGATASAAGAKGLVPAPAAGDQAKLLTGGGIYAAILGVVAQSGGVPIGALMEYGSNTNGEYWRFANGLQICTRTIVTGPANTAQGPIYVSASVSGGSLPINFATTPALVPMGCTNVGLGWVTMYTFPSSSSWGAWALYSGQSSSVNGQIWLTAIGRWF